MVRRMMLALAIAAGMTAAAAAAAYSPVVTMNVTLPGGQTKTLSAPESGLAVVTLNDGDQVGFRPTILDERPWSKVLVTVFQMPTAAHATETLGDVELTTGSHAVATRTEPSFKIAVTKVALPGPALS